MKLQYEQVSDYTFHSKSFYLIKRVIQSVFLVIPTADRLLAKYGTC
jgi:hypothetical protein